MNIAQIQKKGLEPMHSDHSRAVRGDDTPQGHFSELIRNMLGSSSGALADVGFIAPDIKVELKQIEKKEVKEQENDTAKSEVKKEEEQKDTELEAKVQENQAVEAEVEEVVIVENKAVAQEIVLERTDRFAKNEQAPTLVIDKSIEAARAREQLAQPAVQQLEAQATQVDSQDGFRGNGNPEKFVNRANLREERAVSEVAERVSDSFQPLDASEPVAQVSATVNSAAASKQAQQQPVSAELAAAFAGLVGNPAETSGERPTLGNQVSAIAGLGDAKERAAQLNRGAKSELSQKAQTNEMVEKIRELIQQANQSKDPNTISVRIDPAGLGAMTVKISQKGDQTLARIIPESPETEAMLRSKVNEIAQALQNSGLKAENVHVSIGREQSEADFFKFAQSSGFGNGLTDERSASGNGGQSARPERVWVSPAEHVQHSNVKSSPVIDQGWVA